MPPPPRDVSPEPAEEVQEKKLDITLRPQTFADYIGQPEIKRNLTIAIQAAKQRKEPLEHILVHGSPGLGKTTLAHVITHEMGANIRVTSGPALERQGDIAAIITNLEENDVLFIDEIHRLRPIVEETLYSAMEDYSIDIILGKGPSARSMRLNLPRFTLIGATTKLSLLSSPLRDRFGHVYRLDFYASDEIEAIIHRSASLLEMDINKDAVARLAQSSRQTPRIANRLLRRIRDFACVEGTITVTLPLVEKTLKYMGIDALGLDSTDRTILKTVIEKFNGGPVGLNTLAAATHEESETLEDIYEPFLLQCGFLERTPRGRLVTSRAYHHLGLLRK
ncbi:MAG: Holliday junction branch migration DNA helicase RuvB [Candidatus Gracilibacteria bacterium]